MDLNFMLAADYVNVAEGGKLNVMGIFTQIQASGFPTLHPEMFIIAQLHALAGEYGREFNIGLLLLDEDGQEILRGVSPRTVPRPEHGRRVEINHIARLAGLVFPKPGTYEFSVLIDNDVKGTLMLEVIQRSTP